MDEDAVPAARPEDAPSAPRRRPFSHRVLVRLAPGLLRLLAKTWRVRVLDPELRARAVDEGAGAVGSFWHGDIPFAIGCHLGMDVSVLVSRHRDGELVAEVAERLGFGTVRGSSTRGGAAGLLEMQRRGAAGRLIAITPDGPRGPAHTVAPGVVWLAATLRRPIVAAGFAASRCWRAGSWDRMRVPKPFARVVAAYEEVAGLPEVEALRDDRVLDEWRERVAAAMARAEARAEAALAEGDDRGTSTEREGSA